MSGSLARIRREVEDLEDVEPSDLRRLIDSLERKFCELVHQAVERGDHVQQGRSAVSFVSDTCRMSRTAAADRLVVGEQLRSLPRIAEALGEGEIGYQAASAICHLSDQLGERRDHIVENDWIGFAQRFSLKQLRYLTFEARHVWDPDGAEISEEDLHDSRYLNVSELGRMYRLDGMLDSEGGAALTAAIRALAMPLGAADSRRPQQRRADALVDLARVAMDGARLPKRSGVRPHLTVTTTIEALKGEAGAPASRLQGEMPISRHTVQRLACDGTLSRVLRAGSVVTDVGRSTRAVSGSQRRALNARYRGCCGPGCDRPLSMTDVHHIEFWGRGGASDLRNMLPLCWFHHRLVHEGGWQVIRAGDGIEWVPPDSALLRRARAPGRYWAA